MAYARGYPLSTLHYQLLLPLLADDFADVDRHDVVGAAADAADEEGTGSIADEAFSLLGRHGSGRIFDDHAWRLVVRFGGVAEDGSIGSRGGDAEFAAEIEALAHVAALGDGADFIQGNGAGRWGLAGGIGGPVGAFARYAHVALSSDEGLERDTIR